MAKDRGAGTKAKLPKRIGGIKVPKKLRKAGADIVAKATSPLGLELIAAGLSLAAAAASDAAARRERAKRPVAPATGDVTPAIGGGAPASVRPGRPVQPPRPSNDPHEIGVALGRMAEAALAGFLKPRS